MSALRCARSVTQASRIASEWPAIGVVVTGKRTQSVGTFCETFPRSVDAVTSAPRAGVTPERGILVTASTDLGNVSTKVPTDWVRFPVSAKPVPGHSVQMRDASISDLAHNNAMITAEALGSTAVRIATDKALRDRIAA